MKKHLSEAEKIKYSYFLSLVSSVLNDTEAPLPYENCSLESIKRIADETRMDAIFDEAVLMLSKKYSVSDELLSYAKNNLNHWIYIDTAMKYEIENLLKCFDKEQIYNLPMKGYFLKNDYPNPFDRSIADYDILFDINDIDSIKNIFKQNGYKFKKNDDQQYHFVKAPFMYIEMHRSLLKKDNKNYSLLENQLEKAKVRDGYSYSKEMTLEDYYIYMLLHSAKHFSQGGIGIRMIADEYVFYKKYSDQLNQKYLSEQFEKLGITLFEKKLRDISLKWFSKGSEVKNFDDVEEYILLSMTLGRVDVAVMSEMERRRVNTETGRKKSRFVNFISSLFPNKTYMANKYSFVEKMPILLPYSWACMWCRRIFIDRNINIKKGFNNRTSYTDDDVSYFTYIQKEVGFDVK
jgi:hypothetical protein